MDNKISNYPRILAIAPAVRGIGYAIMEGRDTLVISGIKSGTDSQNEKPVRNVKSLIDQYGPEVIVLEDCFAKDSRRRERVKDMTRKLADLGKTSGIETVLLSRLQARMAHFPDGTGTKDAQAKIVAEHFPEETGDDLPPQRRAWDRENYHMGKFEAVALALAFRRMAGAVSAPKSSLGERE
jgi:hypothetical protein